MKVRAWSLITIGGDRQYAGNRGYNDDPRRVYRYDSHVANCRNVRPGDLALIRDRKHLLGLARIEHIKETSATKVMLRCPACGNGDLKQRKRKQPKFRCDNGHEFQHPREQATNVTAFEAHYETTYVDAPDAVPVSEVKAAALRRSDQLSIEEVDIGRLERSLVRAYPLARTLIASFLQSDTIGAADAADSTRDQDTESGGEPAQVSSYLPSMADTRSEILRTIKQRRGQQKFRNALLKRYGRHCLVTGCELLDVIEAAHIWPYRAQSDNHPGNGLLLRADVHTLFDMDLIAIHPETLMVNVAPVLRNVPEYASLDGQGLRVKPSMRPARDALNHRWAVFKERWLGDR